MGTLVINDDVRSICDYILDNGHEEENYINHCRENNRSVLAFKDSDHIFVKALVVKNGGDILKSIVEFVEGYSLTMDDIENLSDTISLDNGYLTSFLAQSDYLHKQVTELILDNITDDDLKDDFDEGFLKDAELLKIVKRLGIDSYLEEEIIKGW